jgi:hypothetical protein
MPHKRGSRSADKDAHRAAEEQPGEENMAEEQHAQGQTAQAGHGDGHHDATQRAEEMVDWLGEKARHYTSVTGYYLLWFASRVREEAEDIWAEAQAIRRGPQS